MSEDSGALGVGWVEQAALLREESGLALIVPSRFISTAMELRINSQDTHLGVVTVGEPGMDYGRSLNGGLLDPCRGCS